jgi:hypothetical protein
MMAGSLIGICIVDGMRLVYESPHSIFVYHPTAASCACFSRHDASATVKSTVAF